MSQLLRHTLAQLQLSTLIQLAADPDIKELMTPNAKRTLDKIRNMPGPMIKSASFVIPDRPISSHRPQEISLKELLDWYSSPEGGQKWLEKPTTQEGRPLNATANEKDRTEPDRNRVKNGLKYMSKFLARAGRKAEEARARFDKAVQEWKGARSDKTIGSEILDTAYHSLIKEAAYLTYATDLLSLVFLHYNKYLNKVEAAGFDVTAYRKKSEDAFNEKSATNAQSGNYRSLSFFNIPPNILKDIKNYTSCNQLFCIANDEQLKDKYKVTGKPNYPALAYNAYSELGVPIPEWAKQYPQEIMARMLQSTDFPTSSAAWILGFHENPGKSGTNGQGGHAKSPWRWQEEMKRISAHGEVLWREQETGASRTQIFKEIAEEYGCTESTISDWFHRKPEKKRARRKQNREKK